jgi:hypothetical protein
LTDLEKKGNILRTSKVNDAKPENLKKITHLTKGELMKKKTPKKPRNPRRYSEKKREIPFPTGDWKPTEKK